MELTLLLDNGVDLHSFQPTAEDIMKISTCDLFIYVGGESDNWVKDATKNSKNKDRVVIDLMESLGDAVKTEEMKEGMHGDEHDHEDGDEHDHEDGDEHDHEDGEHEDEHEHHHEDGEEEYDEHIWLSLRNAKVCCEAIEKGLEKADAENAAAYKANLDSYTAKLDELDKAYEKAVSEAKVKTLVFADRFPFRYMTEDYGLDYYAAFVSCSAETEASFETISFLAGKLDELGLNNVITIEGSDGKIAETVIKTSKAGNQKILKLNSLQAVGAKEVKEGVDYISIMQSNLEVIKTGLAN